MAKKINQAAISAAIKKMNETCPHCTKGKVGKAKCAKCHGTGKK